MPEREIPFFKSGLLFASRDIAEMAATQSSLVHKSRVYSSVEFPAFATMSHVEVGDMHCYGLCQSGTIVRDADNPCTDVAVGVLLAGNLQVFVGGRSYRGSAGDCIVALPADAAVQVGTDIRSILVRVPIHDATLVRIRALPFTQRAPISRLLKAEEATNTRRLFTFFAKEYDRLDGGNQGKSEYLARIAGTLRLHVIHTLSRLIGVSTSGDPEKLRICLACDEFIWNHPASRPTAPQLANYAVCSVRQLYRAFEEIADISPLAYALRIRLLRVRRDILASAGTDQSIRQIAEHNGFTVASRFTIAYEAEFGESPLCTKKSKEALLSATIESFLGPHVVAG